MATQGRPRKTWTDAEIEQFKKLCGIFCTRKECAAIMGIDVRTLDKLIANHFPDTPTWGEVFEYYSSTGRATLRRKMFELAIDGDKTALIFMAKNYLGMSDNGLTDTKAEIRKPKAKLATFSSSAKFAKAVNG